MFTVNHLLNVEKEWKMLKLKQYRLIWGGIIAFGVILLGMSTVYADDQYVFDEVGVDDIVNGSIPHYSTRTTKTVNSGDIYAVYSPSCTRSGTDYRATGGGCSLQYAGARNGLEASRPTPNHTFALPTGWECRGINYLSHRINVTAHVICTRLP